MKRKYKNHTVLFFALIITISCRTSGPEKKEVENSSIKGLKGLVNSVFRMSQGQDSIGYSSISFESLKDKLRLHEKSIIPGFEEEMDVYISENMRMDSVRVYGTFQGKKLDCFSKLESGRLSGYSIFPLSVEKEGIKIDTIVEAPFYERAVSIFLLPLNLDFTKDEANYLQYNSNDGKIRKITATRQNEINVSVPAGNFDCYHLQLKGGVATQNLFIAKSEKRIVKITFENVPWVYELLP